MSHFEVDLKSMRSTMRALEEELGTALVSQLNAEDQQEVHVWPIMSLILHNCKNRATLKVQSV